MIPFDEGSIWFSGKEMQSNKKLCDYLGKNEKTKVIVKIQKVFYCIINVVLGSVSKKLSFAFLFFSIEF